jgi:hypothetical protein
MENRHRQKDIRYLLHNTQLQPAVGKKELREINMEFNARYIKDDDMPGRSGCSFAR